MYFANAIGQPITDIEVVLELNSRGYYQLQPIPLPIPEGEKVPTEPVITPVLPEPTPVIPPVVPEIEPTPGMPPLMPALTPTPAITPAMPALTPTELKEEKKPPYLWLILGGLAILALSEEKPARRRYGGRFIRTTGTARAI